MATIEPHKGGFKITHTTREVFGVDDDSIPTCEMSKDCPSPVTHIGSKGYVYCAEHAFVRRVSDMERTRKMQVWERKLIAQGEPIPSYTRTRKGGQ